MILYTRWKQVQVFKGGFGNMYVVEVRKNRVTGGLNFRTTDTKGVVNYQASETLTQEHLEKINIWNSEND